MGKVQKFEKKVTKFTEAFDMFEKKSCDKNIIHPRMNAAERVLAEGYCGIRAGVVERWENADANEYRHLTQNSGHQRRFFQAFRGEWNHSHSAVVSEAVRVHALSIRTALLEVKVNTPEENAALKIADEARDTANLYAAENGVEVSDETNSIVKNILLDEELNSVSEAASRATAAAKNIGAGGCDSAMSIAMVRQYATTTKSLADFKAEKPSNEVADLIGAERLLIAVKDALIDAGKTMNEEGSLVAAFQVIQEKCGFADLIVSAEIVNDAIAEKALPVRNPQRV